MPKAQLAWIKAARVITKCESSPTSARIVGLPYDTARALRRFGLSVLWRMHEAKPRALPRIELGRYSEDVRAFLSGSARWPGRVALLIGLVDVDSSTPIRESAAFFDSEKKRGYHEHGFYVAGWLFYCLVGSCIPPESMLIGGDRGLGNTVAIVREADLGMLRTAAKHARLAEPVGRLKASLQASRATIGRAFKASQDHTT